MDNVADVSTTHEGNTAVLKTDGSLWFWGWSLGPVEDNTRTSLLTPVKVMDDVVSMTTYYMIGVAALKSDGSLWTMGVIIGGSCSFTMELTPQKLKDDVETFTAGSGNGTYIIATATDGSMWGIGSNGSGQMGAGINNFSSFVRIFDQDCIEAEPTPTIAPTPTPTVPPAIPQTPPHDGVNILLNGVYLTFEVPPIIVDGRTFVPLRAIVEALGAVLGWDGDTQTITAVKGTDTVIMRVGQTSYTINGITHTMDVAPRIINNRTLIPLRVISEAFGCEVEWDGDTQTVKITY
jgi:hypothetical protein